MRRALLVAGLLYALLCQSALAATVTISPGANLNTVFQQRAPGDVVMMNAGSYSGTTFTRSPSVVPNNSVRPDGNEVTFRPVLGALVTVGHIEMGAFSTPLSSRPGGVTFEGLTFGGGIDLKGSHDVHIHASRFINDMIFGSHANYTSITGSEFTGMAGQGDIIQFNSVAASGGAGCQNEAASNILIEDNDLHDVHGTNPSVDHPDTIQFCGDGFNNVTLRGNRFWQNDNINIRSDNGAGWVVENNAFGGTTTAEVTRFYSAAIDGGDDMLVRNNTFDGAVQPRVTTANDGQRWVGNLLPAYGGGCAPNGTFNVYYGSSSPSCSGAGNRRISSAGFVGQFDYHLTSSSGAIGAGDPGNFPALDFDGQLRTSPPDAGADERSGVTPEPTPTPTATPTETPFPTPTPTPTPDPCEDLRTENAQLRSQVEELQAQVGSLEALLAQRTSERDQARAARDVALDKVSRMRQLAVDSVATADE
jgi:hypothetical protein